MKQFLQYLNNVSYWKDSKSSLLFKNIDKIPYRYELCHSGEIVLVPKNCFTDMVSIFVRPVTVYWGNFN